MEMEILVCVKLLNTHPKFVSLRNWRPKVRSTSKNYFLQLYPHKKSKFNFMIQKLTEIGVNDF